MPPPTDRTPRPEASPRLASFVDALRRGGRSRAMPLEQALQELGLLDAATLAALKAEDAALLGRHCTQLVTRRLLTHEQLGAAVARMSGLPGVKTVDLEHAPAALLDVLFPAHAPPAWPRPARTMAELAAALVAVQRQPIVDLRSAIESLRLLDPVILERLLQQTPQLLRGHHQLFVRKGLLTQEELGHALARSSGIPDVDALHFQVDPAAFDALRPRDARIYGVLPLGRHGDAFFVASPTPTDAELHRKLGETTGLTVLMVWADEASISARIEQVEHHGVGVLTSADTMEWKPPPPAELRLETVERERERGVQDLVELASAEVAAASLDQEEPIGAVGERSGMAQLVRRMLIDAREAGASDIHIETALGDGAPIVRMRVDGDLRPYQALPAGLRAALVSRIKIMAKLDISEHRRPQDGKILVTEPGAGKLEIRVAILPTHDGMENVVLRLLGSARPVPLVELGLQPRDLEVLRRMMQRSFGIVLVAGPTGSGKTTTLHSMLLEMNKPERKIWTVEDPIEITQPGLNQVQVNPKIGLTFASAMRSFLRADPDIIMVGEIRDGETAEVAIEASLTGHLVLSTLHTNSAAESVLRLLELGVDSANFADSLVGVIAQRLVRKLCIDCREVRPLARDEADALVVEYVAHGRLSRDEGERRLLAAAGAASLGDLSAGHARGCKKCGGKGYRGRIGVYEVLDNVPPMQDLVRRHAAPPEIVEAAQATGMHTLRHDALEKVVQGLLDLEQARAAYL